ncbi:MAG: hypothetical protein BZ136_01615 [Methanosphaera sp. rholeuAM74]|nr:MAG: hypothetical protein BZ136_01615 [Methanosphaera sp. rholeuAM74]
MDVLTIIIVLILFILAMIFVFSTALLTPYIGKKNLVSVILLGLVVGLVGGTFLLSPIVNDLPDFTRTLVEESVDGTDNIGLELSTNGNLTEILHNISSINGVESVNYEGITFKITSEFETPNDRERFKEAITSSNENITDLIEVDNETFLVKIAENGEPQGVLDSIYSTFSHNTYIHLKYTSMQANATVKASNVTKIMDELKKSDVVILNVTGPTEDMVNTINKYLPNEVNVILLSGLLGVVVAIAGFFVDSIFTFTSNFRRKRRNKPTDRERIKRKVVPGTERRTAPGRNRRKPNPNSIDIFDDSFDESPKQNIGSNRRFRQVTNEDNLKESGKSKDKKSGGRFSKMFNRSSSKKSSEEKIVKEKASDKKVKAKNKRKVPRVRPKRKE